MNRRFIGFLKCRHEIIKNHIKKRFEKKIPKNDYNNESKRNYKFIPLNKRH